MRTCSNHKILYSLPSNFALINTDELLEENRVEQETGYAIDPKYLSKLPQGFCSKEIEN